MQDFVTIQTPGTTAPEQPALPQAAKGPAKGIEVTPRALDKIRSGMAKEGISPEEGGLRLGVLGGGCSGLSYSIKFDTRPRERDRVYEFDGVRLFVDPKSFVYLHGNFINPNSTRSCGCGSSFS